MSTEDKIIEAAIELVYEKGYKGATTRRFLKTQMYLRMSPMNG